MNKIEPAYVTFEQAKWLKEIGFDIPTIARYIEYKERFIPCPNDPLWKNHPKHKELIISTSYQTEDNGFSLNHKDMKYFNWNEINPARCYFISAPEQWQVIEYLEQKGIIIELIVDGWGDDNFVSEENLCYRVFIWQIGKPKPKHNDDLGAFATKREAYNAAFDYIKNNNLC